MFIKHLRTIRVKTDLPLDYLYLIVTGAVSAIAKLFARSRLSDTDTLNTVNN